MMASVLNKLRKEISDCYGGQPIDARQFHSQMVLKADNKDLETIKENMVDINEYKSFMSQLKQSNTQLTQTIYVLIEYLNNVNMNKGEYIK